MLMLYMSLIETQEERETFEKIYHKYRKLMHYCAKQILKDDKLAEDAVHDAFLKMIKFLDKIKEVECNKTKRFVIIIVENAAKDIYRKNIRKMEVSWEEIELTYQFPVATEMEKVSVVETSILELPLIYRQIFILKYAYGYSNKEISKILDVKEGTVRQRIARGKEKLYKNLQEKGVYIDE